MKEGGAEEGKKLGGGKKNWVGMSRIPPQVRNSTRMRAVFFNNNFCSGRCSLDQRAALPRSRKEEDPSSHCASLLAACPKNYRVVVGDRAMGRRMTHGRTYILAALHCTEFGFQKIIRNPWTYDAAAVCSILLDRHYDIDLLVYVLFWKPGPCSSSQDEWPED